MSNDPFTIFLIVGVLISVISTIFWVVMLIEIITKETSQGDTKIIWIIVVLFAGILGALLYYFIRRPKRMREMGQ